MAGPTDIYDLAVDLLNGAVASLDEIPLADATLKGSPERRIISPGVPVDDCCEQLAVHINPVSEAATGLTQGPGAVGTRKNRAWINLVHFTITIGRCIPTVEVVNNKPVLPTADEITEASKQIDADGWALWNGVHNRIAAGEIFDRCSAVFFDPLNARTPSGGCGGWTLDLRAHVDGYRPIGS